MAKDLSPGPDDLTLTVVDGNDLDLAGLSIRKRKTIPLDGGGRLLLQIIGEAAHAWMLVGRDDTPIVTEVLARKGSGYIKVGKLRLIEHARTLFPVSSFGTEGGRGDTAYRYTVLVRRMPLGEVPLSVQQGALCLSCAQGGGRSFRTELYVQNMNHGSNGFKIWTRHDYPSAGVVIWTEGRLYSRGGVHEVLLQAEPKAEEGEQDALSVTA